MLERERKHVQKKGTLLKFEGEKKVLLKERRRPAWGMREVHQAGIRARRRW